MTERSAPDPVAVEKAARELEDGRLLSERIALMLAAYREHVRPADPERAPDGYELLVEDGIAVFRYPSEDEEYVHPWSGEAVRFFSSASSLDLTKFGGRRFILVPADDERTRIAKALRRPTFPRSWGELPQHRRDWWLAEAGRLLAAGVRFPEAES